MTDFPCHSIPFTEEGLENYDKIFGKDNCEEEHEDVSAEVSWSVGNAVDDLKCYTERARVGLMGKMRIEK